MMTLSSILVYSQAFNLVFNQYWPENNSCAFIMFCFFNQKHETELKYAKKSLSTNYTAFH